MFATATLSMIVEPILTLRDYFSVFTQPGPEGDIQVSPKQTFAFLLDHLVGGYQERLGNGEAQCFCSLTVDE